MTGVDLGIPPAVESVVKKTESRKRPDTQEFDPPKSAREEKPARRDPKLV